MEKTKEEKVGIKRILKFAGVGIAATVVDYLIYTLLIMVLFGGDVAAAGISSILSGICSTFVAYVLHNNITWKERNPGKYGIIKFFVWNAFVVILVRPVLVAFFSLLTGLYEFAFMLIGWIPVFSSFDFVASTGIYVLMTIVTMTLNFIFYEKIVFGRSKEDGEKVDIKSVRESGKEQQAKGKADQDSKK